MNIKNIRALAEILQETGLTGLEVWEGETKIRLERAPAPQTVTVMAEPAAVQAAPAAAAVTAAAPAQEAGVVDYNDMTEVKSPMVGVFYAAPAPDAKPYVQVGDKVKKGDVLCIIEAMKLMNEIQADADGEIADICVQNGDLVEYGQTLFKIC